MSEYTEHYSDESFWTKVKRFALKAGKEVIRTALILYYVAQDPETPKHIKAVIYGALGYFIIPLDAIPDVAPAIGFSDDLGVLLAALALAKVFTKPEHEQQADKLLREWFGEDNEEDETPGLGASPYWQNIIGRIGPEGPIDLDTSEEPERRS